MNALAALGKRRIQMNSTVGLQGFEPPTKDYES
jgi:hypothetical protein